MSTHNSIVSEITLQEWKQNILSDEGKIENLLPAEMLLKMCKREVFRLNKSATVRQLGMPAVKQEGQK